MIAPVTAVAQEIRSRKQGIGQAKLHKLLYYVQGYHLAWEGRPAFAEEIEAWRMGPVIARLWRAEKRGLTSDSHEPLPDTVRNTVTNVLVRFGDQTGAALIKATHAEDPWRKVTAEGRFVANQVIDHQSLIHFFSRDTPEVRRMRRILASVRDDTPFIPDPPGALSELATANSPR